VLLADANAGLLWEHSGRHGCHPTNGWGMDRGWGWFMNNVLSLQLARERAWPSRGKGLGLPPWNSETTGPEEQSTSNETLVERLEAENAQLRSSVVELVLQIQILRHGSRTLSA
jgi:hypothetical protein